LAAASNILHSITLDYYRNRYLDYLLDRDAVLGDDLKHHRKDYEEISQQKKHFFVKLLYKIYFAYSSIQLLFVSKDKNKSRKIYERNDFLRRNKKIIWFWTFIGPTTAWTLFIVTSVSGIIEYYLWGLIIVFNGLLLLLYLIQLVVNEKTLQIKKL
jgi:hypothetical protein